jgi:hypothetical protein
VHKLIDTSKYVNRFGWELDFAFDPHDTKYLYSGARKLLHAEITKIKEKGVKVQIVKEDDIIFDDEGVERIGKRNVYYIRTNKNYCCGEE